MTPFNYASVSHGQQKETSFRSFRHEQKLTERGVQKRTKLTGKSTIRELFVMLIIAAATIFILLSIRHYF